MLVLSRFPGQDIKIGDNITVKVTKVVGDTVRLAIDAPKDVRVLRGELQPEEAQLTLKQWMERWEQAVENGQSRISREEAERRYINAYGKDRQQNDDQ